MFTEQEAKALLERVFSYSKLPECEAQLTSTETVFIRFANNGITTSGYQVDQALSLTSKTKDGRMGSSTINELSEETLQRGVAQSEELARISKPDPEYVAALGPQQYPKLQNFDGFTAGARNEAMIPHVKAIIDSAKSKNLMAAGFMTRTATSAAVGNKAGLFGFHAYTDSSLSNTMRNFNGSSSGWSAQVSSCLKDLDGQHVGRVSSDKCVNGANKRRLEPGKYNVILEPAAVTDLIRVFGWGLSARDAEQGQSFLSRKGKPGETLVGDKLFPDTITLRSDPFQTKLSVAPWGDSLVPNEPTSWIEKGVMRNLYWDRYWARKAGHKATSRPTNLILEGQQNTLEDLIRSAGKAVLVTRFWYVRPLQWQTLQMTGLTRDGVFLVENGKVTAPVMNFRWNESPVRVLRNTQKLTAALPAAGSEGSTAFAPAILATDFNFASISDAV